MVLAVDQELFGAFAFYSAIVIVKMMLMAFLTARQVRCPAVWCGLHCSSPGRVW